MQSLAYLTIAVGTTMFTGAVEGYANPGPCSGVCVNTHDPYVIRRDDGRYFRFSTGGRIAVHSAPSIEGPWEFDGAALPDGSSIDLPGNQDLWAPDVIRDGNTYYLYYAVSEFGSQDSAIGVATSPSLDVGSWTDLGHTGVSSADGDDINAIDANLIRAGDAWHMTFGSFWANIFQVPMGSPPVAVAEGAPGPHQIAFDPVTTAVEGAFIFPYADAFWLFYSKGKCCGFDADMPAPGEEYHIMACRSDRHDGGFVDADGVDCQQGGGTVVLESHGFVYGPGGQGVLEDPVAGPVLYYHYVDTNIGFGDGQKQFGWNQIDFSSGWPVV